MTLDNKADGKDDLREQVEHLPIPEFANQNRRQGWAACREQILALIDAHDRKLAEERRRLAIEQLRSLSEAIGRRIINYTGRLHLIDPSNTAAASAEEEDRSIIKEIAKRIAELSQNPLALSTSTGEEMPPRDPEQLYSVFQDASTGTKRE